MYYIKIYLSSKKYWIDKKQTNIAREHQNYRAFPMAQWVKNLPAMQKTQIQSLNQEDPLEKEMAIHSGILAWEISWTEEPGGL